MKLCKQNDLQVSTLKTKLVYWSKSKTKNHQKYMEIYGQKWKSQIQENTWEQLLIIS